MIKDHKKIELLFVIASIVLAAFLIAILIKGLTFVAKKTVTAFGWGEEKPTEEIKFNLEELEKIKPLLEKR